MAASSSCREAVRIPASFFGTSDARPGPGSEVLVPAEDPNAKKTDYVAQILASAVAIIVVVTR